MQVQCIRKHVVKNIHLSFVENIFMLIINYYGSNSRKLKKNTEVGILRKLANETQPISKAILLLCLVPIKAKL